MANERAHDPGNPAEWQEAVDYANFYVAFDAARQYGLVTGGPRVNVERCQEILERGKAMGITPRPDSIERIVRAGG